MISRCLDWLVVRLRRVEGKMEGIRSLVDTENIIRLMDDLLASTDYERGEDVTTSSGRKIVYHNNGEEFTVRSKKVGNDKYTMSVEYKDSRKSSEWLDNLFAFNLGMQGRGALA